MRRVLRFGECPCVVKGCFTNTSYHPNTRVRVTFNLLASEFVTDDPGSNPDQRYARRRDRQIYKLEE
jgi:hypothetical protein